MLAQSFQVREVLERVSSQTRPDKIVATTRVPRPQPLHTQRYIMALDRLNDPGNMGSLVRTAAALGWDGVFFVRPCVDPFNAKALSASAHSSTPISRSPRVRRSTRTILSSEQSTSDFRVMARSVPAPNVHRSGTACDPVEEEVLIELYGFPYLVGNGPQPL